MVKRRLRSMTPTFRSQSICARGKFERQFAGDVVDPMISGLHDAKGMRLNQLRPALSLFNWIVSVFWREGGLEVEFRLSIVFFPPKDK